MRQQRENLFIQNPIAEYRISFLEEIQTYKRKERVKKTRLTVNEVFKAGALVIETAVVGLEYDLLEETNILHSSIDAIKVVTIKYSYKQHYTKNCLNRAAKFGIMYMAVTLMTSIDQLIEQRLTI